MVSVQVVGRESAGRFLFYLETPVGNFSAPRCLYVLLPLCGGDTSLPALILEAMETGGVAPRDPDASVGPEEVYE